MREGSRICKRCGEKEWEGGAKQRLFYAKRLIYDNGEYRTDGAGVKMNGHKWKDFGDCKICQRCGWGCPPGDRSRPEIDCLEAQKRNETHKWEDWEGKWGCSKCGANGWEVKEGPPIAFESCGYRQMKKALG
jgi:hypothetical protein